MIRASIKPGAVQPRRIGGDGRPPRPALVSGGELLALSLRARAPVTFGEAERLSI